MSLDFKPELKPLPEEPACATIACQPALPVAGFWLRLAAFAVDILLLSVVTYQVAKLGFDALYPLREVTPFIGLFVVFLYFVIGNSPLTGGRTFGRWMLQIRLVALDTPPVEPFGLPWGRAIVRALITQGYVFFYAYIITTIFTIVAGLFGIRLYLMPAYPEDMLLASLLLGFALLAGAYVLGVSVFIGLYPKKQAPHDMWLKAAIFRVGGEIAGTEFMQSEEEYAKTRLKLAIYPAVTLALMVLLLDGYFLVQRIPVSREPTPALTETRAFLDKEVPNLKNTLRLMGVVEPSEEEATRLAKRLESEQEWRKSQSIEPITSETLRLYPNGRKYHFYFFSQSAALTSETLPSNPTYQELGAALPRAAATLSAKQEPGKAAPYDAVQAEVSAMLPLYLYTEHRAVRADIFAK